MNSNKHRSRPVQRLECNAIGLVGGAAGRIRTCALRVKSPLLYRTELRRRAATVARLGRCRFAAHDFKLLNSEAANLELIDPKLLYLAAPDREPPDRERANRQRADRESTDGKRAHAAGAKRRVLKLSRRSLL